MVTDLFATSPVPVLDAFTVGTTVAAWAARACPSTLRRWLAQGRLRSLRGSRGKHLLRPRDVRDLLRAGQRRKGYGLAGPRHGGEWYTASDLSHAKVARRLGRSSRAICVQRCRMRAGKTQDRQVLRRMRAPRPGDVVGRWFVTPHAVARYRLRVANVSYERALADLIRISAAAREYRRTARSTEYRVAGLRLIVVPSPKGLPALVTVVPR